LILCRNVAIYFAEEAKSGVFAKLARSLRPDGILFVGGSEIIPQPSRFGLSRVGVGFYRRW
jgi:chemotaxis protein methyltransferase CheR